VQHHSISLLSSKSLSQCQATADESPLTRPKFFVDLFYISIWKAFKNLKSERRVGNANGTDFQEENYKFYSGISKGLSPSTTPFWKKKVLLGFLN
jgi:hypothetical protein